MIEAILDRLKHLRSNLATEEQPNLTEGSNELKILELQIRINELELLKTRV